MKKSLLLLTILLISGCGSAVIKEEIKPGQSAVIQEKAFMRPSLPLDNEFDIAVTGDIMVGRRMKELIDKNGYGYPFRFVKDELLSCNITFGNLEAPLIYSDRQEKLVRNGKKAVYLFSDENVGRQLAESGFNIMSLANNHSLDYGEEALLQSMEILDKNNIAYCGVWKGNKGLPNVPCLIETEGTKVGFLCYSGVSDAQFEAGVKTYGTIPALMTVIGKDIAKAKKSTDLLIVYLHWGREGEEVNKGQRSMAKKIIDAGADLVIGSHTHLFQDIEIYKGKYIFYGLGNFIFDQLADETKKSAIVKVHVKDKTITGAKIIPVYSEYFRPEPMDSEKALGFAKGLTLTGVSTEEILDIKTAEQ